MTFKYRLKTYQNEEGEYTEYLPATRELLLVLIAMHWTNETMPNGLEIISVENMDGQHLLLEHSNKQVFEVYFLPKERGLHFHRKSNIDTVLDALDLFFKGHIQEIKTILNKTRKDDRYIRGDFFFIDHNYRYTLERALRQVVWVLWPGLIVAACLSMPAFVDEDSYFPLWFGLVVFSIGVLPGLYLHFSYRNDFIGWMVRVTRGSDKILVRSPSKSKEFSKSEILHVTQHAVPIDQKSMWPDYGYLEIAFKSGEIVNISNLICNQLDILNKFPDEVDKLTVGSWLPTLRNPTRID